MKEQLVNVVVNEDVTLMILSCQKVFIISLLAATFSKFLEMTFQSGMIFRRYYLFLNLMWIKYRKKRKLRSLLKPMGLCIYCYSVWIYFFMYFICFYIDIFIIFGLGINFVVLYFLNKCINL